LKLRLDRSIPLGSTFLRASLIAVGVCALVAARWFPFGALPPLCAFKTFTGLPCLSCGMTRSWVHVVHGRFGDAWLTSPLGVLLCLATVAAIAYGVARSTGRMPALRLDLSKAGRLGVRIAVGLAVLINWGYVLVGGRV
jgi:hypothetical protein